MYSEKVKRIYVTKETFNSYPAYMKSALSYSNKSIDHANLAIDNHREKKYKEKYFHFKKSGYYLEVSKEIRRKQRKLTDSEMEAIKKKHLFR